MGEEEADVEQMVNINTRQAYASLAFFRFENER